MSSLCRNVTIAVPRWRAALAARRRGPRNVAAPLRGGWNAGRPFSGGRKGKGEQRHIASCASTTRALSLQLPIADAGVALARAPCALPPGNP